MILGLIRILILDIYGAVEAYRRAGDKKLAWGDAIRKTLRWLFPFKSAFTRRPVYSVISILFHIGLILVPIFLLAHVQLWQDSIGISWWSLPDFWADFLTLLTIGGGLALLLGRIGSKGARLLSRRQDYLWPPLLILPFITGYFCANTALAPQTYRIMMLIHVLTGELILVLLPFTKIAHCVLVPFSQFIIALAWKFPARVDDKICTSLNKKGAPV
jgi:nitrate reductase gamma subunit